MATMGRRQDAADAARWRDQQLADLGLLDPDQPTETAHVQHRRRMRSEFTADERAMVREMLGL